MVSLALSVYNHSFIWAMFGFYESQTLKNGGFFLILIVCILEITCSFVVERIHQLFSLQFLALDSKIHSLIVAYTGSVVS